MKHRLVTVAMAVVLLSTSLLAAGGVQSPGFKGTTTTQKGDVRLPGVAVTVLDSQGREVAATQSGEDGQFSVARIPPGRYTVVAKLSGFRETKRLIDIQTASIADVNLDLEVAITDTVSVVVKEADSGFASSLASREVASAKTLEQLPVGGDSIQAALRVISSVTERTGGVRIKGGRTDQSSLQFGRVIVNDPTGGSGMFRLPVDAIDAIEVLPNPYGAEFGGFSSGLVVVRPRTPPDAWTFRPNGWPSFLTTRDNPFHPVALREFNPRAVLAGPLRQGRLSLMVSAQARYKSEQVWSRPQSDRINTTDGSLFTRLDGRVGARHALIATFGYFPSTTEHSDLSTFTPQEATVNLNQHGVTAALVDSFQMEPATALESTVAVARFGSQSQSQGGATMVVTPDQILGNFYNDQDRRATTMQISEVFSTVRRGMFGMHFLKAGLDMLSTDYSETSTSRPIEVRRADRTLAETLAFDALTTRRARTTDVAGFLQDTWQMTSRVLVEAGLRLEHNGVFNTRTLAPRGAATLALRADGSAALRAGIGIFPDRVPPSVQSFAALGSQIETRYSADGLSPIEPAVTFVHTLAPDLRTPRSLTWNVEYDEHLTPGLSVRLNYLDRRGSHELVVDPIRDGGTGVFLLSTTGQSVYREAEVALRYRRDNVIDLAASYSRSQSSANLNGYSTFYGLKLNPFVRPDAYAPTDVNAPNRFLFWTTVSAVPDWLFGAVASARSGFPYSVVDEYLDFVGPRNDGRAFPVGVSLDVSVEWHVKFDKLARKLGPMGKLRPWIGFTLFNALDSNLPIDVQQNLGSGSFGSFYNSPQRQFRISLRYRR